jgi:excisionase family DNA binding protein
VTTLASIEPSDEILRIDELCEWLKISKNTIYKQRSEGTGPPAYRIGKHLRFVRSEVLEWLATKRDSA